MSKVLTTIYIFCCLVYLWCCTVQDAIRASGLMLLEEKEGEGVSWAPRFRRWCPRHLLLWANVSRREFGKLFSRGCSEPLVLTHFMLFPEYKEVVFLVPQKTRGFEEEGQDAGCCLSKNCVALGVNLLSLNFCPFSCIVVDFGLLLEMNMNSKTIESNTFCATSLLLLRCCSCISASSVLGTGTFRKKDIEAAWYLMRWALFAVNIIAEPMLYLHVRHSETPVALPPLTIRDCYVSWFPLWPHHGLL